MRGKRAAAVAGTVAVVGTIAGLAAKCGHEARRERCTEFLDGARADMKADDRLTNQAALSRLASAERKLSWAKAACSERDAEMVVGLSKEIELRRADLLARVDAGVGATVAVNDLPNAAPDPVESFRERSKLIAWKIDKVQWLVAQSRWEDASVTLQTVQGMLDDYKGTSVEQTDAYRALAKRVEAQSKIVEPQLDRILEARRNEAASSPRASPSSPSSGRFVVTRRGMFLFDSPSACKEAGRRAARNDDFASFVAEHGTPVMEGARVRQVDSTGFFPVYRKVVDESSGSAGWISDEFLRPE